VKYCTYVDSVSLSLSLYGISYDERCQPVDQGTEVLHGTTTRSSLFSTPHTHNKKKNEDEDVEKGLETLQEFLYNHQHHCEVAKETE
jgi:hypothetical protein